MNDLLVLFGFLPIIWISIGLYVAGHFYPQYSHKTQFCSELGAIGSPTQKLSPVINNFPLGIIFCILGMLLFEQTQNPIIIFTAICVVIHGIGTVVAGTFGMDLDPYIKTPSRSGIIHSWAGFIMFMSLLIPQVSIFFTDYIAISITFKMFCLIYLVLTLYFTVKLKKAYQAKTYPGLYQRLSYGVQLIWLSHLGFILAN
jgi:hypothetical protein